ncbi:hypothetical protein C8J57DRAFT_1300332 [Mycena rebaudengoi]|nr:hypothetical protein C8J57DRAFT_1300332 [Mycena rebaudengoi]
MLGGEETRWRPRAGLWVDLSFVLCEQLDYVRRNSSVSSTRASSGICSTVTTSSGYPRPAVSSASCASSASIPWSSLTPGIQAGSGTSACDAAALKTVSGISSAWRTLRFLHAGPADAKACLMLTGLEGRLVRALATICSVSLYIYTCTGSPPKSDILGWFWCYPKVPVGWCICTYY